MDLEKQEKEAVQNSKEDSDASHLAVSKALKTEQEKNELKSKELEDLKKNKTGAQKQIVEESKGPAKEDV